MRLVASSLVVITLSQLISGCQSIGESDFACPGRPEGVRCMRATEVYEATHNSDSVRPTAMEPGGKPEPEHEHPVGDSAAKPAVTPSTQDRSTIRDEYGVTAVMATSLTPEATKPIPIRTPAKVMRGWIAPWEDSNQVLRAGGYVFVEVEERRWMFGEPDSTATPVRYFSLDAAKDNRITAPVPGQPAATAKATSTVPSSQSNASISSTAYAPPKAGK